MVGPRVEVTSKEDDSSPVTEDRVSPSSSILVNVERREVFEMCPRVKEGEG